MDVEEALVHSRYFLSLEHDVETLKNYIELSRKISPHKKNIMGRFSKIYESKILVPGLSDPLQPWSEWQTVNSPEWWVGYNKAKHYRHSSYISANLKNMLMAMSALMVSILYLFRLIANKPWANPWPLPKFFDSKYTSPNMICRADRELPDFEQ